MASEIQTIDNTAASDGQWQACFRGWATAPMAWNISAGDLQTALIATRWINTGDVAVTGSQAAGYTVTFQGDYADQDVPQILVCGTLTSAGITSATTQQGTTTGLYFEPLDHSPVFNFFKGFGIYADNTQAAFVTTPGSDVGFWLDAINGNSYTFSGTAPKLNSTGGVDYTSGAAVMVGSFTGAPLGDDDRTAYVSSILKDWSASTNAMWGLGTWAGASPMQHMYLNHISGAFWIDCSFNAIGFSDPIAPDTTNYHSWALSTTSGDFAVTSKMYFDGSPQTYSLLADFSPGTHVMDTVAGTPQMGVAGLSNFICGSAQLYSDILSDDDMAMLDADQQPAAASRSPWWNIYAEQLINV